MKKILAILVAAVLVCSVIVPISAEEGVSLTGLYHEKFYSVFGNAGYKVDFDPEKEVITTSNTHTRSMLNYSHDMTSFDSSVAIKSITGTGLIQAGVAFHVQDKTLTSTYNPTTGYFVFVRRNTTNLKKLEIVVRYLENDTQKKAEVAKTISNFTDEKNVSVRFDLSVTETDFTAKVYDSKGTLLMETAKYKINANGMNYTSGAFVLTGNGAYEFSDFSITSYGEMADIPTPDEIPSTGGSGGEGVVNPLTDKFDLYAEDYFSTADGGYTTVSSNARAILKTGSKDSFSAELPIKLNDDGEIKAGLVFRVSSVGVGTDNMQGYSLIVDTTKDDKIRLYLYKYGPKSGSSTNAYIGVIGTFVSVDEIVPTAGKELVLHLNVVDKTAQAYIYEKNNSSVKSEMLTGALDAVVKNSAVDYYSTGKIGAYIATGGYLVNLSALEVGNSEEIEKDEDSPLTGGTAAVDNSNGSAVRGNASSVTNVTASNITAPSVDKLAEYAADFDNYTMYSSSTSNKFVRTESGLTSTTTGTKRALLDGVTVKGFHSTATMKISEEGTLRSGIVFRVNKVKESLADDGTLASNNLQGYAAILYKTPGTTDSYARVVLCIYKYGVKKGKPYFLGTVASKASEIPLKGCEKNIEDAAGKELTIDVNVIGDDISAYFYNTKNPELKSEILVANLKDITDIENSTPSLRGVHYEKGAIGLTAQDYVTFTNFNVSEPVYPSTEVGDLSKLDSYTLYGSGVTEENGYFVANSSGTKKLIVNNLTVTDFKASVDMTIDSNGNLKAGFFFRVNDIGNGADAQTGFAAVVSRNYSTNGENNPNRIDIVVFKWGYLNGKLSYLGEVAREAYKNGTSFVDGKMAGEELTFVVSLKGAAFDATLFHKKDPTNKPVTFSSNLKFSATKEKNGAAYFESGSVGLYLGNSVSDPVNKTMLRNFHIDDGSGVRVMSTGRSKSNKILGIIPLTGEGIFILIVGAVFVISACVFFTVYVCNKRGKRVKTGETL